MHTMRLSLPVKQALNLDESGLSRLGVIDIHVDSIEPGCTCVEVDLDVDDTADDTRITALLLAR